MLITFIKNNVISVATVLTDGRIGYSSFAKTGFNHDVKLMKDDKKLIRSFLRLKGGYQGSCHGAVKEKIPSILPRRIRFPL
jgi:hypothetical protein